MPDDNNQDDTPDLHGNASNGGSQFGAVAARVGEGVAAGAITLGLAAGAKAVVSRFARGASKTAAEETARGAASGGSRFSPL